MRLRPAVFLDRDGTLIEHVHYLSDPARSGFSPEPPRLSRGSAGPASRVLVTNQSAVGRGMITEARLHEIHAEMGRQLADRVWRSMPSITARTSRPAMTGPWWRMTASPVLACCSGRRTELGLDLPASWMVGDLISDVLPA